MSIILAMAFGLGSAFGRMGVLSKHVVVSAGTPTGDGTMDFSNATGDDTGLLAILEDI
jgi:hypothetical protein